MYQAVSLHATQMIHSSYLLWVHVKLLFSTLDSLVLHNIFTRGELKKNGNIVTKMKYCTFSVPQNVSSLSMTIEC